MYPEPLHHAIYAANYNLHQVHFNSDSMINVDNHCSATMSTTHDHFKDLKLKQIGESIVTGMELNV